MKLHLIVKDDALKITTPACATCKLKGRSSPHHRTMLIHYRRDSVYTSARCRYIAIGAPGCGFEGYIESSELLFNIVKKKQKKQEKAREKDGHRDRPQQKHESEFPEHSGTHSSW